VVSSKEILQRLHASHTLVPIERGPLSGPAQEFSIVGAPGKIGVIAPLSGHFCQDCNRIRITSSGTVRTCLFSDREFDLKPLLLTEDVIQVADKLRQLVSDKPACHTLNSNSSAYSPFSMAQIGG